MKKRLIFALCAITTGIQSANAKHDGRADMSGTDKTIESIGDYTQMAIPLSALLYSVIIGDYEGTWQLTKAVGSTALTTEALKIITNEERLYQPEGGSGRTFPSGHTSFAFGGAAFWQRRYGWYVGAPMYAAATFVAYSRVRAEMHNPLDVTVAAALGIGFNYLFTTKYNNSDTQVYVAPTDGGAQLRFNTTF